LALEHSPTKHERAGMNGAPAPALEARLVAAARDGDRAAFGRLYDRFAPMRMLREALGRSERP
jgi:hypothetical protein